VGKKREQSGKKTLVYGSLYMDVGESYEYAETQVDGCITKAGQPQEKILLAFDIVATPTQIASGRAREWGQHILDYCDQHYPKLGARVVGITDDDSRRLFRDTLITRRLTGKEIDGVHLIEME
jgi:hypothetical protein